MAEVITRSGEGAEQQRVQSSPGGEALPDIQCAQCGTVAVKGHTTLDIDADGFVNRNADAFQCGEQIGVGDDAGPAPG